MQAGRKGIDPCAGKGEGFIRFTGFPEREEQYGELSCDSDDGALLGPCCSLLGET